MFDQTEGTLVVQQQQQNWKPVEHGEEGFDAPGRRTPFEEIEIGKVVGPISWRLSKRMIDRQVIITSEFDDWHVKSSPYGDPVATIWTSYRAERRLLSDYVNVRGLVVGVDFESFHPLQAGMYWLTVSITEKWQAKGRDFFKYEVICTDESGREMYRLRRTNVMQFRNTEGQAREYEVEKADTGRQDEPTVSRDTPIGHELEPVPLDLTNGAIVAMEMGSFSHPDAPRNIHSDHEAAAREGLPALVGAGPHMASPISHMMLNSFRAGWTEGGKLDIRFKMLGLPGQLLAKGVVKSKADEGPSVRVHCDVWVENQDGDILVAGQASALVS
jgi:acyl dehydratase